MKPKKKFKEQLPIAHHAMFMAVLTRASRSRDPVAPEGAVLTYDEHIIGSAPNGIRPPLRDSDVNWTTDRNLYIDCAIRAVLMLRPDMPRGGIIYSTHPPCPGCVPELRYRAVSRVISLPRNPIDEAIRTACGRSSVTLEVYSGNLNLLRDLMESLKDEGYFS